MYQDSKKYEALYTPKFTYESLFSNKSLWKHVKDLVNTSDNISCWLTNKTSLSHAAYEAHIKMTND
jgi:hypothetical protein